MKIISVCNAASIKISPIPSTNINPGNFYHQHFRGGVFLQKKTHGGWFPSGFSSKISMVWCNKLSSFALNVEQQQKLRKWKFKRCSHPEKNGEWEKLSFIKVKYIITLNFNLWYWNFCLFWGHFFVLFWGFCPEYNLIKFT